MLVAKGLSKCSTPCFVSYIQQIQDSNSLDIKQYLIDDLLRHADAKYDKLFKSNKWMVGTTQSPMNTGTVAAFVARNIICYNCKKKGHIQWNCPNRVETVAMRAVMQMEVTSKTGMGKGKGKGAADPLHMPPKPGKPRVKEFKGKMLKWCGTCPKLGDHDNEKHRAMLAASHDQEKKGTDMQTTEQSGTSCMPFAGLVSHF